MTVQNRLFDAMSTLNVVATAAKQATARSAAKKSYTTPVPMATANGALAKKGTGSKVLDMFAKGGTYRTCTDAKIVDLIKPALKEEAPLFGACLFYLRDVLEGQGERNFFRVSLNYLAQKHPDVVVNLLPYIPNYGRWDDLLALKGTDVYATALNYYATTLRTEHTMLTVDPKAQISLAAKWAPSEKAGKASHRLWRDMVALFDSPAQYRRIVTKLRKRIKLVESAMCAKEWSEIDYSKVPSRASLLYRKAFKKNDAERYNEFLLSLKGKTKEEIRKSIKATTLYPYELVSKYIDSYGAAHDDTVDILWEALPDYLNGNHKNALAVVDTSGSMNSSVAGGVTAMSVALSIGLYLADNATGPWANKFITFSESPKFQSVTGSTLWEKVRNMERADWDMNTNLNKVFTEILDIAKRLKLSQDELPETVFVISDMQFDEASGRKRTNFEQLSADYAEAGYVRPNLVFWTVTPGDVSPVQYNEYGVALISGFSANGFKHAMGADYVEPPTPEQVMRDVLEAPRYQPIRDIFSSLVK